jgi:hypothetical protein
VNGEDGGTGPGGDGGFAAGGGGGGGYYGGGGGGGSSPGSLRAGGGGGAGASFITPLGVDTSFTSDKTGIPMVTISPAQLLLGANGGAEITAASLTPNPFCTKLTRNCPHPGAQLAFKLAKRATLHVVVTDRHEGNVLRRRTLDGVAGANSFAIDGKGLKQGRYLMILTAVRDGAASKPVRIRFRISKS